MPKVTFAGVESRFSPENLPHNLALVDAREELGRAEAGHPRADRAGMADGAEAVDRAHPRTTQMAHMLENIGAASVQFTPEEVAELNASVSAIQIQGARLPDAVLAFSDVEAPEKS